MKEKKTVFLGDSITRGYGVSSGEGWVELLHRGKNINHGIDGDTTGGHAAPVFRPCRAGAAGACGHHGRCQ